MKPGLTLPAVGSSDAILADRIDDHIRTVASTINGGLTTENLAPGSSLASSQFAERYSIYTLNRLTTGATTTLRIGATSPVANSRLISLSVTLVSNTSVATPPAIPQTPMQFAVVVNGVTRFVSPTIQPYSLPVTRTAIVLVPNTTGNMRFTNFDPATYSTMTFPLDDNVVVGTALPVDINTLSGASSSWGYRYFVLSLATIHSA